MNIKSIKSGNKFSPSFFFRNPHLQSILASSKLRVPLKNPIKKKSREMIIKHVFAISPPLDPYKSSLAIDNIYSFYRKYFLKKWKRSLIKKQQLFPEKYDFNKMLKAKTCMDIYGFVSVPSKRSLPTLCD
jgi:hypothetical protein